MRLLLFVLLLWPAGLTAQDNRLRLAVPERLAQTGLLDYLLPRFSLKTAVPVDRVGFDDPADAAFVADGTCRPAFVGDGAEWRFVLTGTAPQAQRFQDWLFSEVGGRTITAYQRDGVDVFSLPEDGRATQTTQTVETAQGRRGGVVALQHCGRCHVVSEANRMKAIGSTPSFALIRTFDDWEARFSAFFALKPHPSFTQLEGLTDPFDPSRPPPIVPLRLTPTQLDDIVAYVRGIAPADLGAPLQSQ